MRVFRHFLVVGVSGAITLSNVGQGSGATAPIQPPDHPLKSNPPQLEENPSKSSLQDPGLPQQGPMATAQGASLPQPNHQSVDPRVLPDLLQGQLPFLTRITPEMPQIATGDGAASPMGREIPKKPTRHQTVLTQIAPPEAIEDHASGAFSHPQPTPQQMAQESGTPTPATAPVVAPTPSPSNTETVLEDYPPQTPNGTLQTNPPSFLEPHPNPLRFPTQPEEVTIEKTEPITLQQAIDLARRNNQDLQVAQLQLEQSKAALRQEQAALLPQLSFQSDLQYSVSASSTLQQRAQNIRARRLPGVSEDFRTLGATQFNNTLQLTYDTGLDGGRGARIAASEETIRLRELEYERIAEQLRFDVADSYYTLQESDSRVEIATAAVENSKKSLGDAEALERAGVGTRFDVLQAQVQLANEQQTLTEAIRDQRTARRRLAEQLNINQSANLTAADPVERAGVWRRSLEESIVLAFKNRAELEQQLVERKRNEDLQNVALASTRPNVSLFANYNVLGLSPDEGSPYAVRGWADGFAFGARLQWNFFDGGAAKAAARQRELDSQIAEARFSQTRNQIRREVEQGYYQLEASFDNIGTAELGLKQAEEALRLARLRFQAGVGTQTDVINQDTELTRARGNLLRAIIGYNRALSSLHRAVTNLPDGSLSDVP